MVDESTVSREAAADTGHCAKIWMRRFRREDAGSQELQLIAADEHRKALFRNDGIPADGIPPLAGHFGRSIDWGDLDIPKYGSTLLPFRATVATVVEPFLSRFGEFHDCETEVGPLRLFRCLNIVDALESDVHTITKDNGFGLTKEFRFDPAKLPRGEVFTLPHCLSVPHVLYPDEFINLIDQAGISHSPFALMFDEAAGFYEIADW